MHDTKSDNPSAAGPLTPEHAADILQDIYPELRRHARRQLGDRLRRREESVDIAQSACRIALCALERRPFISAKHFVRWAFRVVGCKTRERARYHTAARRDQRREQPLPDSGDARLEAHGATPLSLCEQNEWRAAVQRALAQLPPVDAKLIQLHRDGFSVDEIAAQLGASSGTVRTRYSRALARIAPMLPRP